jgi:hypothetical protein
LGKGSRKLGVVPTEIVNSLGKILLTIHYFSFTINYLATTGSLSSARDRFAFSFFLGRFKELMFLDIRVNSRFEATERRLDRFVLTDYNLGH